MTKKITYEKLLTYAKHATAYISRGERTKLAYAIERFGRNYPKYISAYDEIIEERQAKINDVYTDFASEDSDNNIMRLIVKDEQGKVTYTENKYTRENKKLCDEAIRKVNREYASILQDLIYKEVEIEPHFTTSVPDNLTTQEMEAFMGIVIDPVKASSNGHAKHLEEATL